MNGPARGGDGDRHHVIALSIDDLAYSGLARSLALHLFTHKLEGQFTFG